MLTGIITIGSVVITGIIMATIVMRGDLNRKIIRDLHRIGTITTTLSLAVVVTAGLTTVIIIGVSNRVA